MNKIFKIFYFFILFIFKTAQVNAMHIDEGVLPISHTLIYFLICVPFFIIGIKELKKKTSKGKNVKMFIALTGAYCFVLSALKLPSVTGSCSHPTGVGFGAIVLGPLVMTIIGLIVLLFQAIFLAHGGITSLGANTFSMAIIGPIVAYIVFKIFKNKNRKVAVFLAAFLGDLSTYIITSIQLSLAFPSKIGGFIESFEKFGSIFAVTQIPLAIAEGILTVILFDIVEKYSSNNLNSLLEEQYYEN